MVLYPKRLGVSSVRPLSRGPRGRKTPWVGLTEAHGATHPTPPLLRPEARVESVAQRVAEEVEREDREADRKPGEDRHPRRRLGELNGGAAKHEAPRGGRLRHAEAEERERRLEQDRLP